MFSSIQPPSLNSPLKILTYNIQQGYGPDGQKNYFGQLKVMRQANADIVGLQETDTNRISGGNDDLAGFLANQLGMYVYYGPTSANGTFGIVLLSRFPIEHPKTFYMYSTGEQTAAISAQVTKAGKTYNIMVTHLGNGGPLIQQQQVLQEASKKDNLILMGDFNFYSREEQFQETTALLENAWLQRWPDGSDDQGSTIADQIDHVFISPSLHVSEARYLTAPESDHPALLVAIDD